VQSPSGPLPVGEFDGVSGISPYITPISPEDEFYLIDTALQKPEVDPSTWTLTINGEYVDTPVTYTYEELLARPMVEREVTLSCVSNPVGGNLVGNAVWSGIPLTELFEEAGIQDPTNGQHQVFSRSVDGFEAGTTTLGGIAWSPTIGIEKVEVFVGMDAAESDDDANWTQVELANVESDETWVQWRHDWDATPGDWLIRVRATDKNGVTQSPIPVAPAPNGAEGYATIVVRVA